MLRDGDDPRVLEGELVVPARTLGAPKPRKQTKRFGTGMTTRQMLDMSAGGE